MECLLCGHEKVYEHGTTCKGTKRYHCPNCKKTFVEGVAQDTDDKVKL